MKSMTGKMIYVWAMAILLVLGLGTQASAASAGMVSTAQLTQKVQMDGHQTSVTRFLEREDVQGRLLARGVDIADAQVRIHNMTATELSLLSAQIDELPAGEGMLETVLFLLVIFMLLDIAGVTDIFPGL